MSSLCHELCPVTVHSNVRAVRRCQYKQEKPSSLTPVHDPSLEGSHVFPRGGCCLALTTMTSSLSSPSHQSFGRKGIHNSVQHRHVKATCETPKWINHDRWGVPPAVVQTLITGWCHGIVRRQTTTTTTTATATTKMLSEWTYRIYTDVIGLLLWVLREVAMEIILDM